MPLSGVYPLPGSLPSEIAFRIMYVETCFQTLIIWQPNLNTDSGCTSVRFSKYTVLYRTGNNYRASYNTREIQCSRRCDANLSNKLTPHRFKHLSIIYISCISRLVSAEGRGTSEAIQSRIDRTQMYWSWLHKFHLYLLPCSCAWASYWASVSLRLTWYINQFRLLSAISFLGNGG